MESDEVKEHIEKSEPESESSKERIIEVLNSVVGESARLEAEAKVILASKEPGYREKLVDRAELLVSLPDKITEISNVDPEAKQRALEFAHQISSMAREALESEGTFALSTLLTSRGNEKGEKNDLQKFIDILQRT